MFTNAQLDDATRAALVIRLKSIEGQARGIQRMIDDCRNCQEIMDQLAALRAATHAVAMEKPAPDVGEGAFLGEERAPALADLTEGKRVLLVEPNELQAEATVRMVELDGRRWWFGEIGDPDAIEVIYPDTPNAPDPTAGPRHPAEP